MKQRNIPWLGAIVESVFNTLPVLSAINFISIAAVLYTSIDDYLATWVPWINFWSFILIMCAGTIGIMVIVYIFILPSLWGFRGQQMFEYKDKVVGVRSNEDRLEDFKKLCDEMGLEVTIKEKGKR